MQDNLSPPNESSQQQLGKIEIQRQALERLFRITRSVENLRVGLETTLTLGEPAGHRLEKGMSLYKELDQKTRNFSNEEVLLRLKRIDKNLQQHLSVTLKHVAHINNLDSDEASELSLTTLHHNIKDFKRATQTMVALQVLLNLRGVSTQPRTFNLSKTVLQKKINATKDREKYYRQKVKVDTLVLENDIKQLLSAESCTDSMRLTLNSVLQGLEANRQHIDQGHDINDLPYGIDMITLTDSEKVEVAEKEEPPTPEIATKAKISEKCQPPQPTDSPNQKVGLCKGIMLWFNTPWSVSIKDIFKHKRQSLEKKQTH